MPSRLMPLVLSVKCKRSHCSWPHPHPHLNLSTSAPMGMPSKNPCVNNSSSRTTTVVEMESIIRTQAHGWIIVSRNKPWIHRGCLLKRSTITFAGRLWVLPSLNTPLKNHQPPPPPPWPLPYNNLSHHHLWITASIITTKRSCHAYFNPRLLLPHHAPSSPSLWSPPPPSIPPNMPFNSLASISCNTYQPRPTPTCLNSGWVAPMVPCRSSNATSP